MIVPVTPLVIINGRQMPAPVDLSLAAREWAFTLQQLVAGKTVSDAVYAANIKTKQDPTNIHGLYWTVLGNHGVKLWSIQ